MSEWASIQARAGKRLHLSLEPFVPLRLIQISCQAYLQQSGSH